MSAWIALAQVVVTIYLAIAVQRMESERSRYQAIAPFYTVAIAEVQELTGSMVTGSSPTSLRAIIPAALKLPLLRLRHQTLLAACNSDEWTGLQNALKEGVSKVNGLDDNALTVLGNDPAKDPLVQIHTAAAALLQALTDETTKKLSQAGKD